MSPADYKSAYKTIMDDHFADSMEITFNGTAGKSTLHYEKVSWLIDGVTPIEDVLRVLSLDDLPHAGDYETLAGFLMVMLRRVPRRTDSVAWGGYKFEVLDVDSYRIDQVMVTRLPHALAEISNV